MSPYFSLFTSMKGCALLNEFLDKLYQNFIYQDRWTWLLQGLGTTLAVTACAVLVGVALGFLVALTRTTNDKVWAHEHPRTFGAKIAHFFKRFLNTLASLYLTIIRGTPILVQLMIINFGIFSAASVDKFFVAVIGFGINSGAYVAEIFRGGIMSVDSGQMEAGRSLGLSYKTTMWKIVMPQAVKNVLPALGNEFITLLKETSVAYVIALPELTRAGDLIRSRTFDPFIPMLAVAAIYLVVVIILTKLLKVLERRLAKSDRG